MIIFTLGGDQQEDIVDSLRVAGNKGHWVCLKNMHLATNFLNDLERVLDSISNNCHEDFRLWLTTEKNNAIPSSLIERSFKIMYEAPTGMRENMKQTFSRWEESSLFGTANTKTGLDDHNKTKALFILAWIHAILQGRASFGRQGWRQKHEFTSGDLLAAENVIDIYHQSSDFIQIIQFFLVHFVYGGKIGNHSDHLVLKAYVEKYLSEQILDGNAELFPGIRILRRWDNQSHHRAIRAFPTLVSPALFGLPCNGYKTVNSTTAILTAQKLQKLGESNFSNDESESPRWVNAVEQLIQYWESNCCERIEEHNFTVNQGKISKDTSSDKNIQHFFHAELLVGQQLHDIVSSAIALLVKALNGETDLESILFQQLRDSLMDGQVPSQWEQLWSGPDNPIAWIGEMTKKRRKLNMHYQNYNEIMSSSSHTIDLSNFFNPSAFLFTMQRVAVREKLCSIDDVTIFAQFESPQEEKNIMDSDNISVRIAGLFLKGCILDEKPGSRFVVRPMEVNSPEYQCTPPVRLHFLGSSEIQNAVTNGVDTIMIPVYCNATEEDFLFQVSVSCETMSFSDQILSSMGLYLDC